MPLEIEDAMYRAFDQATVRSLLGIGPDDAPVGLILHAVYDMPRFARRWRDGLLVTQASGSSA